MVDFEIKFPVLRNSESPLPDIEPTKFDRQSRKLRPTKSFLASSHRSSHAERAAVVKNDRRSINCSSDRSFKRRANTCTHIARREILGCRDPLLPLIKAKPRIGRASCDLA